jgi:hypothetical protein
MPAFTMVLRAGMQAASKKRFFEADGLSLEHVGECEQFD